MRFAVAMLQNAPHGNDQVRNVEKGLKRCADMAVFRELWNIGATLCPFGAVARESWSAAAIDRRNNFLLSLAALAQGLRMNIVLNYLEAHPRKPRNSVSIINRTAPMAMLGLLLTIAQKGEQAKRGTTG